MRVLCKWLFRCGWLIMVLHVCELRAITHNINSDEPTWYYSIDGSADALDKFEKDEYRWQYFDNAIDRGTNCFSVLVHISTLRLEETAVFKKTKYYYRRNIAPDEKTDMLWGVDVEVGNQGSGLPLCSNNGERTAAYLQPTCPYCMEPAAQVVIFIGAHTPVDRYESSNHKARCRISKKKPCSEGTCSNGYYAEKYLTLLNGIINNSPVCSECKVGTWLTCKKAATCTWKIPVNSGDALGDAVYTTGESPIGQCFPCKIAEDYSHYMDSAGLTIIQRGSEYFCPGGASAPKLCQANARSNAAKTGCLCVPGYYFAAGSECLRCEPGYMCNEGVRTQCPMHTYQDEDGQTKCKPCTTGKNGDGRGDVTCDTNQLPQWCDTGVANTQNRALGLNCVSCTQCRRPYLHDTPNAANTVNCYRG